MKNLKLALQFLTRFPVKIHEEIEEQDLGRSMALFPLIGLIIGVFNFLVFYFVSLFFPVSVAAVSTILFDVFITGNIHIDGLMDTADGVFSGRERTRMLEIMKDSRVGSHGVMAGVLVVLLKYTLLIAIPTSLIPYALILSAVLGRWSQVFGASRFPYARKEGGTGGFTKSVGNSELLWASLWTAFIVIGTTIITTKPLFIVSFPFAFIVAIFLDKYCCRKLGGLTGDVYGAVTEIVEVMMLMLILTL